MSNCPACGLPSPDGELCMRPECLTYGSGAIVAGPPVVSGALYVRVRSEEEL